MHGRVLSRKPFVALTLTEEASLTDVTLFSGGHGHGGGDEGHGHGHGHDHGHGNDHSSKHGHGGNY